MERMNKGSGIFYRGRRVSHTISGGWVLHSFAEYWTTNTVCMIHGILLYLDRWESVYKRYIRHPVNKGQKLDSLQLVRRGLFRSQNYELSKLMEHNLRRNVGAFKFKVFNAVLIYHPLVTFVSTTVHERKITQKPLWDNSPNSVSTLQGSYGKS